MRTWQSVRTHLHMPDSWPAAARRWALGLIAVGGTLDAVLLSGSRWRAAEMSLFAALMICGTLVTLAQRWFGAPNRSPNEASVDLQSMWIFAAALLLSPVYAAMAPLALEWSSPPSSNSGLVNRLLNVASLGISGAAASALASSVAGVTGPLLGDPSLLASLPAWRLVGGVALAITVFVALNGVTIAEMVHRHHGGARLAALGGWSGLAAEGAVQCTGALLATAWALARPLGVLTLPPLVLLQRSLLHSQLLAAARTDAKTGLINSTHWRQLADADLRRARIAGRPLAVALVDLDHFKQVNDVYGHLQGDEVLVATARALTAASRPGDVVGRFGGEEFAVLLPGLSSRAALGVGDRLRLAIGDLHADGAVGLARMTASVGIAALGEHGDDIDTLLRAADRALYVAKNAGRNQVQVAAVERAAPTSPAVEPAVEPAFEPASAAQ